MSQPNSTYQDLSQLSDMALLERFERIVASHHRSTAALLAHLAQVDARRLYSGRSHSSMFGYCTSELCMTRDEAYNRITAARTLRDYPELQDYVASGKLHLTAIKRLAAHLTRDNARSLFEAASGKTKEQVELMLAERFPKPDVAASLRKFPQSCQSNQPSQPSQSNQSSRTHSQPSAAAVTLSAPPPRCAAKPKLEPLSPKRYKLQLTASEGLVEKLKTAQHLLKHQLPAGDIDVVLERALDELIDKLKKKRFAAGSTKPRASKPRASKPRVSQPQRKRTATERSRHVSAADKREVLERDGLRCTFVDGRGRRCEERGGLELAHIEPHGRGGDAVASNLRLRCRAHNRLDADRDFGRSKMNRVIDQARQGRRRPEPAPTLAEQPTVDPRQVEMY